MSRRRLDRSAPCGSLAAILPHTCAAAVLAALLLACAPASHPPASSVLTALIPPGADAIAFADLDRLRATALYARLPVPAPLANASGVLAILDGKDWAIAARGPFRKPPSGATLLAPDLAAAGAPRLLGAMQQRPNGGAQLLAHAPTGAPLWLVALGSATLPFTGNLTNLNRLLHQAEYTAIALAISNRVEIDATAYCATPAQALHLEENIRALASLARFQSLAVSADGAAVHVTAALSFASLPDLR